MCRSKNLTFLTVVKAQLVFCNLNGIFYYCIDKNGKLKCSIYSISICLYSVLTFFIVIISSYTHCPIINKDDDYFFIFSMTTYVILFYLFSTYVWFAWKNKKILQIIRNYTIIDKILLRKLNAKIDYEKCKFYNNMRMMTTYVIFALIAFNETIYIALAQENKTLYFCAILYVIYYYISAIINWLYQTFMYETKIRFKVLQTYSRHNNLSAQDILSFKIIYCLVVALLKLVKELFTLHALCRVGGLFFGSLSFTSFIITTKVEISTEYFINLISYTCTMLLVIFEMVLFVYAFQSLKDEVSVNILYILINCKNPMKKALRLSIEILSI